MAKNNTVSWIKLVITVTILLVTFAIAWATVRYNVEENTEDIETNVQNIQTLDKRTDEVEKDIIGIQTDIKYIRDGVDDIKEKL